MSILDIICRTQPLFDEDIRRHESILVGEIRQSSFLVIGGGGSIGQAIVKEIFARQPRRLHVVDISENNLVELVRDLRSSHGYIDGDFRTFSIDCGSREFEVFFAAEGPYEYVLNLSALKHVRSERDPYTLMRMMDVNVSNTIKTLDLAIDSGAKKYFCVSTDKAANPANLMGASKRIMEMYLTQTAGEIAVSTARFANVAFSNGSLLEGFERRLAKGQPLAGPSDIRRYFVTQKEAGQLCLLSALLGKSREIYFPKLREELNLVTFREIAARLLSSRGYEPVFLEDEAEARSSVDALASKKKWPCVFTPSDTSGEKPFEEFYTAGEETNFEEYADIGIVMNEHKQTPEKLASFTTSLEKMKMLGSWTTDDIVTEVQEVLSEFAYVRKARNLDQKM